MERLTVKTGVYQNGKHEIIAGMKCGMELNDIFDRLAAIEDILCDGTGEYDLDRLRVLCNQRMTMRDEVSQRFSLTAKISLDRLREIAEAEREGLCVCCP